MVTFFGGGGLSFVSLSLSPYGFNSFNLSCSSLAVLEAALGDLDDLEGLACLVDLC
jgi:hypothetical protein